MIMSIMPVSWSSLAVTVDAFCYTVMSMHFIDGKGHKAELKSNSTSELFLSIELISAGMRLVS